MTSTIQRGHGFAAAWARTFGTTPDLPKASRGLTATLAVIALLGTGAAAAAWQVNDTKTQQEIKELQNRIGKNGNVIDKLNDVNRKLRVNPRGGTTPEMIATPTGDEALNATQPTASAVGIDQLCTSGAATGLGSSQQQLCKDLANTELAQYRFSMRMFERSKENYDRLKQIEDHRRTLGADDYANIQQNTNELLALTALMDNDRDRYNTYMSAYEARIAHIRNSQAALTRNALKGSGSLSMPIIK
ncbi:hypothetical protein LU699_12800 [Luteimonas fraxinea]|uniref:Uncharacterized protein n=1 Tax=Luteimonas fraxinea TaxID=2901869 RepID=A0ABS8UGL4_9GAMM|nr:hypothetical protein [Luteimonas fraxinea]MCD9098107.1 hypothetical protein [Luteimonas fraxinea]MCD9125362.1 hypothetical protein [Luteimonas fraxinea]UHH09167.1 hypothetical protein LU699_12800 [Luteimonas fraxinea]